MKKLLIIVIALVTVVAVTKAKGENRQINFMLDGKTIARLKNHA